eukprot:4357946-Amphidinium_carterae.1
MAVTRDAYALQWAAATCRGNRAIVLQAMAGGAWFTLQWATDDLITDSSFASEEKRMLYIVKVGLLSGSSHCVVFRDVPCCAGVDGEWILDDCYESLGLQRSEG